MADKGYTIGQGFIQILPSTSDFGSTLKREINTDLSEDGKSTAGTFSGGFKKGLAAVGVAVAAAGAGAVALTKQVISARGQYEQLEGGIRKLFGNDFQQVAANADKAFKTAGMSANEYMETVTNFSSSLIQGLDGDTKAAVSYADMAIRDMSDNANTFGTSMQSIQYAYQGFAKQNYTMLDNLKLGYGGTKTEMQRLLQDANAVKEAHGELADLSIENFSDIVEAIHIMQEEMNIAGTTAREADGTIEGSINSLKASWQNLLAGMGDSSADINKLTENFTQSFSNVYENIKPVAENVMKVLPKTLSTVFDAAADILPDAISSLLPSVISGVFSLASGIIQKLPDILGGVAQGIVDGIFKVAMGKTFTEMIEAERDYLGLINEMEQAQDKLGSSIDNTKESYLDSVVGINSNAEAAKTLMGRIEELAGVENKSVGQKQQMKDMVEELNGLVPNLGLAYDDVSDSLNTLNQDIYDFIEASKAEALIVPMKEAMIKAYQEQAEAQSQLTDSQQAYDQFISDMTAKGREYADAVIAYAEGNGNALTEMLAVMDPNMKDARELFDHLKEAQDLAAESAKNAAYYEQQLSEQYITLDDTTFNHLREEVTNTFGHLDNTLDKAIESAQEAGIYIPENLVDGLLSQEIPISNAVAIINELVEFDAAEDRALEAGIMIPADITQGLNDNVGLVGGAIDAVNTIIDFKRGIKTAEEAGVDIMRGINDGLTDPAWLDVLYNSADADGQRVIDGLRNGTQSHSPSVAAQNVGFDVLQGLLIGLQNGGYRQSIFATVWDLGVSIIQKVKDAMGVKSPSRYAREIGNFWNEGILIGLDESGNSVIAKAESIADGVVGTAKRIIQNINSHVISDAIDNEIDVHGMGVELQAHMTGTETDAESGFGSGAPVININNYFDGTEGSPEEYASRIVNQIKLEMRMA